MAGDSQRNISCPTPLSPPAAFYFGGDYYLERWTSAFDFEDEALGREDMRLMKLAGANVATVGVFSWVSHQPDEQAFT